jgi:hypothetical protein
LEAIIMKWQEAGENGIIRSSAMCTPLNIMRVMKLRMRCVGHVARMGEMRNLYKILVGQPEGTRPVGRQEAQMGG